MTSLLTSSSRPTVPTPNPSWYTPSQVSICSSKASQSQIALLTHLVFCALEVRAMLFSRSNFSLHLYLNLLILLGGKGHVHAKTRMW